MDCKALIFNSTKQEVITPIYPNQLVKWSLSSTPTIIDKIDLPYVFNVIPNIVLLPDNRFIVSPAEMMLTPRLYIREWSDWQKSESIEMLGDTSDNTIHISNLLLTPCCRYLVLSEGWEDIHLFSLETKQWHRWPRQWDDYAMNIAFNPSLSLMVVNESCTDAYPLLFRIDDIQKGTLTCLEQFGSDITCHQGALSFSPDGNRLLFTHYSYANRDRKQIELVTYQIDRTACKHAKDIDNDASPKRLKEIWKTSLPLSHEHDRLNPWQSDAIWMNNESMIFSVSDCIAKVSATSGRIESTVNVGDIVNAIAPIPSTNQIIAATKNGIKVKQLQRR